MKVNVRKMCVLAMMSALAFILAAHARVPMMQMPGLTLRYDPKDVIIVIAGFIYGPMAAFMVAVVVSFVQMITVSITAYIGFIMNVISSTAFCCTAAYIYKKNPTLKGAIIGLIAGVIFATAVMMLWNYIITPIHFGVPRAAVVPLLIPTFLPFNLIGNSINAVLTVLLFRHVKLMLQATHMVTPAEETSEKGRFNKGVIAVAIFATVSCVLWVLILLGVL